MAERVIEVAAASRKYSAVVGAGVLARLGERSRSVGAGWKRAAILSDAGAGDVSSVESALREAGLEVVRVPAFIPSEQTKTLETVGRMLEALAAARLERGDVVVAIGGGVIGDLAGFAASAYRRGIAWVNCPTTLLSMVDASVGGKTGVNLAVGGSLKKNMAGAFWQPSLVVADVGALATLPEREFRCGLAECLKHGMLAAEFGDAGLGAWTDANMARVVAREKAALVELVARNIGVKARVVGEDEREEAPIGGAATGGRAVLNLGHTFAHVLETLPGQSLKHGEAVGLGLIAASAAAEAAGISPRGLADRTRAAVAGAGLPTHAAGLPQDAELVGLMMDDKKVSGGKLRVILPLGDGRCVVVEGPDRGVVEAGWGGVRG